MENRQIEKSKQSLLEAFSRLCKTRTPAEITVNLLCEVANINRVTFYRHYHNYAAFYAEIERDVIDNLVASLRTYHYDTDWESTQKSFFSYIAENADVVFAVLRHNGGSAFFSILQLRFDDVLPAWQQESTLPPEQLRFMFTYGMFGGFAVAYQWWKSGFQPDLETMSKLITNSMNFGMYHYLYTV